MADIFEATGGARVGWLNASWPLAKLMVTQNVLQIDIRLLGDYRFTPDMVVTITRYSIIPVLGWGVQIQHCVPEYPARLIFWSLGSPDTLLAGIRESGFQPRAPITAVPPRKGFALRWQAIVVGIATWNSLFILDMISQQRTPPIPGVFSLLALGFVVTSTIATLRWSEFQRLVLKPGRSVGEIRALLNLLLLVSSIAFVAVLLITLLQ